MPTEAKKPRWKTCSVLESASICPPAARMVVVSAWANGDERKHEIYPVLAIQVATKHYYSRQKDGSDPQRPPSPAHAEKYGWDWENTDTDYRFLIYEPGLCGLSEAEQLDGANVVWSAFVADWPQAEDEQRLASEIAKLEEKAAVRERETGWNNMHS